MSNGTPVTNPGWQDVAGIFAPFTSQMMWRFNLGSYEDVSANAQIILLRIKTFGDMPPPPFPPLTAAQIQTFQNWVDQGCPQTPTTGGLSAAAPAAATPLAAHEVATTAPPTSPGPGTRFRFQ
jgi:hypothetical protein